MADHKHGEMDITVQKDTYNNFIKFGIWSIVAVLVIVVFLALFAT